MNVNKIIWGGRISTDLALKSTPSGKTILNFSIAEHDYGAETVFMNCTAWEKQAENIVKFLQKGSTVLVIGKLRMNIWTDESGRKIQRPYINVEEVQFVRSQPAETPVRISADMEDITDIPDDGLPF